MTEGKNSPIELRTLAVTFDAHLKPWEVQWFRGAIAQKVGLEHEWFHNHNNETGGYHHRYPMIQYKLDTHRNAMRPMLLCLGNGVEEAHHYFSQPDWSLNIGGQHHDMRIHRLQVQKHRVEFSPKPNIYRLHKWQALNTENFPKFRELRSEAARVQMLDGLLASHCRAFLEGIGYESKAHFDLSILEIHKDEWISYKGIKVQAFTLDFETDLSLPDYIGLGKGSSSGWGVIRRQGWGGEK